MVASVGATQMAWYKSMANKTIATGNPIKSIFFMARIRGYVAVELVVAFCNLMRISEWFRKSTPQGNPELAYWD